MHGEALCRAHAHEAPVTAAMGERPPRTPEHDGVRAEETSGAPSVLVAYGQSDADILAACGLPGAYVPLGDDFAVRTAA